MFVFVFFFLLPFHIQESREPSALFLCMSALLAITAAFGSLQIRKAEFWERKHAFLLYGKCFVGDIIFFHGFLSKNWENRESNSRVHYMSVLTLTIFCWSLSYFLQMFIEDVDGICCFVLFGSFLTQESRESNARVPCLCALLAAETAKRHLRCRLPVHAGLSNCYHCAVRPVWLVNCD